MNTTFKHIKACELYYLASSDVHPANTRFHFSFVHYYNPKRMNYGVLRVLNDDDITPQIGFGHHPC